MQVAKYGKPRFGSEGVIPVYRFKLQINDLASSCSMLFCILPLDS